MRVAIVIDSVPGYRRGFYERLLARDDIELTVFCQSHLKGFNLQLIHNELDGDFVEIPFISTSTHSAAWQRLPVRRLWREFDVCFFHGNPRIMSSVVWATLFRFLGKKIAIWGQAHTAGANSTTEAIRLSWWRLFRNHLVYTDAEVEYLRERRFRNANLVGMNNGLDQDRIEIAKEQWQGDRLGQWQSERGLADKTVLLSCARLIDKNRFDLMIDCLPELIETYPDLHWCVIGSGAEEEPLSRRAEVLNVAGHITWVGELYEEDDLAPWFLSSCVLVHPGAIGLTLMHAFGYGLPVVTHDNLDFQMPEIAAFEDGVNGSYFRQNDTDDLLKTIGGLLADSDTLSGLGDQALATVTERFNSTVMADRFVQVARTALENQ